MDDLSILRAEYSTFDLLGEAVMFKRERVLQRLSQLSYEALPPSLGPRS
jgi:hypothetical protein